MARDSGMFGLTCFIITATASTVWKKCVEKKATSTNADSKNTTAPEFIREEIFSRVQTFFGREKFSCLENAFVIVIGLGSFFHTAFSTPLKLKTQVELGPTPQTCLSAQGWAKLDS